MLQWYQIRDEYVILKFDFAVDTTTLVNSNFSLYNANDATPTTEVTSPFDTINVERDYQGVSRELYLYWNVDLAPSSEYGIVIENLETISRVVKETVTIYFTTKANFATPNISESEYTKEPTNIEDFSIKSIGSLNDSLSGGTESSEKISIVSIYPDEHESYYIDVNSYQGKIEITFNDFIPTNFVNSQDFKVQKKLMSGRGISPWTTVPCLVTQSGTEPIVSIYLPAQTATPLYSYQISDLSDYIFWENGYKYRLIISKEVGY